ncbi:hypothetical protein ILUMI_10555 [Ignelater luminosus]|uniref:Uncharacterized protein n=1 Tax=Ignelater luminosus TaxID=2038154 RepID=A0A8K0G8K4_IGNLU|nr:hypothetical protein ILUMI_10555 [Ignelater luminosus]
MALKINQGYLFQVIAFVLTTLIAATAQAYLYNPYHHLFRYSYPYYHGMGSYANHYSPFLPVPPHTVYADNSLASYLAQPYNLPTLNVMAEVPYSIKTKFTVVPMFVVAKENLNLISDALIIQASREKPTMTVKTETDLLVECTPAVKVLLEKPLIIYSLKTSILFPSEILISHGGLKIPVQVGAVIAPIPHDVFVSADTPFPVDAVYAVPTKPFMIDYVNDNKDVVVNVDNQAVIVENNVNKVNEQPPKNVTILEFPETEAEPQFQVDIEDEEFVNRNPPEGVIPAGIVQSTQPHSSVQTFHNSKESPLLTTLREEAAKNRIKANTIAAIAPSF